MDSRIRELEQWLAEAKRDLGECGQEAYLQKLYLLDAEIRAVIKANGAQPGALSPERQGRLVRGQSRVRLGRKAAVTLSVAGVVLLAATTVAVGLPALRGSSSQLARLFEADRTQRTANSGQPGTAHVLPGAGQSSTTPPAGFIPASLPGEEILPADWTPGSEELTTSVLLAEAQPQLEETSILAGPEYSASSVPARMGELRPNQSGLSRVDISAIMAAQPAARPAVGAFDLSSRPQRLGGFDANQAIDVLVANSGTRDSAGGRDTAAQQQRAAQPQSPAPGELTTLHGDVSASSGGGLGERLVSRWNFGGSSFVVPANYQPSAELDTKKLGKRNNKKNGKHKAQGAGGAKASEPVRETRPGEAEEIRVPSSEAGSPQGNEHGGEVAES